MKILPFVLVFHFNEKQFLCYAVVNLLFTLTTVKAWALHKNPVGGLKWTRTIDLTLIRRVL